MPLSLERLKAVLRYDQETGVFTWAQTQSNRAIAGREAGAISGNGRKHVSIDGEKYPAHRLAWLYVTGEWPKGNIAPLDGDYLNLAFSNLKEETPSETSRKGKTRVTNTSGVPGVSWDNSRGKWIAKITRGYKQVGLGRFDTIEQATEARNRALAECSVALSEEEQRQKRRELAARGRQRGLWERTKKVHPLMLWKSMEEFVADVGSAPKRNHILMVVDATQPIGPGNFCWAPPDLGDFDHKTPEGRSAYGKAHRNAFPMKYRDDELRKKFGIGLEEYQEKLSGQNGVCAICSQPELVTRGDKVRWLAVDHNHETGALRGLLCSACNIGIGNFKDNPELLSKAIEYLKKYSNEGEVKA